MKITKIIILKSACRFFFVLKKMYFKLFLKALINSRGNSTCLELRSVDPTANPYTALAAILASGLDGIKPFGFSR
ncbi:hypothetical protein BMS84_10305 [Leuconostoc pseudomesenteroides]|nr:hypothetical protein BMS84_10305 [Leuconostoc pseudomesenteroides]